MEVSHCSKADELFTEGGLSVFVETKGGGEDSSKKLTCSTFFHTSMYCERVSLSSQGWLGNLKGSVWYQLLFSYSVSCGKNNFCTHHSCVAAKPCIYSALSSNWDHICLFPSNRKHYTGSFKYLSIVTPSCFSWFHTMLLFQALNFFFFFQKPIIFVPFYSYV